MSDYSDLKRLVSELIGGDNLEIRDERYLMSPAFGIRLEALIEESEYLRMALNRVYDSLEREYWSEYAGLDETRAILDAAISSPENP